MKIPFNYPLCTKSECPKAKECLRYMALDNPSLSFATANGVGRHLPPWRQDTAIGLAEYCHYRGRRLHLLWQQHKMRKEEHENKEPL